MRSLFQNKLGINSKTATASMVFVANALVWYICSFSFLTHSVAESDVLVIIEANLLALVLLAVFSAYFIQKFENRLKFLVYWTAIGVFLSALPLLLESSAFISQIAISAVIGGYFGLGLPVFMGYYAAATETENRARLSGVTIFFIGVLSALLSIVSAGDAIASTIALTVWRTAGLVLVISLFPIEIKVNKKERVSFRGLVKSGPLLLYFVPWLMFSLINNLAFPIFEKFGLESATMVENILAAVFAIFCGFFADYIGRKRLLLFGFALIGLGYAALGLFHQSIAGLWFYTCADGIAWGVFTTLFLLTIWGDLADKRDSEKYYLIGFLPYLLSTLIQASIGQFVAVNIDQVATVFSFASFFLFAAVLPLYLAPETLPEKAMKDRNLKSYLEKAQKLAEKETKNHKKGNTEVIAEISQEKQEEAESLEQKNSVEYDEAKKLAEKYY